MKNMSYALTTNQARAQVKDITRRLGWWNVKPGDLIQQVVKEWFSNHEGDLQGLEHEEAIRQAFFGGLLEKQKGLPEWFQMFFLPCFR